jgi:3-oxoacyl-[acyl-carrier-protein] synthase II
MKIAGIGMIFSRGLGVEAFEQALRDGWKKPDQAQAHPALGGTRPAYLVNLSALPGKTLLKKVRRADLVSKMSVLAAADALADSGLGDHTGKKLGIIVATAFGPHVTTFNFLDDILDHGDAAVSPTTFSNSVHNAAASYVAMSLDIKGPTLTVTQFRFSFQAALQLARTWLDQGRCEYVLAGAVDEYGGVLGYVSDHKLTTAEDGRIKPFLFKPTCQVPGEGAAFFLLTNGRAEKTYCSVSGVRTGDDPDAGASVDINIIDADGMLPDESAYLASLSPGVPTTAYAPLFGSMMVGSAFNAAAGAVMLKGQTAYAAPVRDNPRGVRLLARTGSLRIGSIRCTAYDCHGEKAAIYLSRY